MKAIAKVDKIKNQNKKVATYYCKKGDIVDIITENPGEWRTVLVVGFGFERFVMRFDELDIIEEFTLQD